MTTKLIAKAGVLALGLVAAAVQAAAQAPAERLGDPQTVVARVGTAEIRLSDVSRAYEGLPPEYRQVPLTVLFAQVLDQLINRQLMLQAGLAQKLDQDAEIRADVRDYEAFAIQRTYLERYLAGVVTEASIRKEYDATVAADKGVEQVKASHILLQSEADAVAVIQELEGGADFAKLARERSTGPSAPKGGDLGFFNRDQMVAPFAEVAFALADGETTKTPVKTRFGWHVIMVTGRRVQPPPSYEEMREQIHDRLTRDALAAHMAKLRETTKVVKFNPDGSPAE
jgi:peptidyl-prolyl cis-trans isomerase C